MRPDRSMGFFFQLEDYLSNMTALLTCGRHCYGAASKVLEDVVSKSTQVRSVGTGICPAFELSKDCLTQALLCMLFSG